MRRWSFAGAALVVCVTAACSSSNNGTPPSAGAFRVVNGVTDSATLDASIASERIDPQDVALDAASHIADIDRGTYQAELTLANGASFPVNNVSIDPDNVTTVFGYGTLADGTRNGFAAEESITAPPTGQVTIQPVVASYEASQPQSSLAQNFIFTIEPVTGAAGSPIYPTVQFGQTLAPMPVATGQYEITVTRAPVCKTGFNCPPIVSKIYDTGPKGVTLPTIGGGDVFQLVAIDATEDQQDQYGSAIVLLLIDNNGNSTLLYSGQN